MKFPWMSSRRKVVNFLVRPTFQIRYGYYFAGTVIVTALLVGGPLYFVILNMSSVVETGETPGPGGVIWDSMTPMLILALANAFALTFLGFHFGLIATHRIAGPLIPFGRQLEEMKNGIYSSRIKLRDGDELQEIADSLNQLADALEGRRRSEPEGESPEPVAEPAKSEA